MSKVIGILYRLKNTFLSEVLKTLYKSLVLSYINYGLLLWGVEVKNLEVIQKRAIRLITGSNYIAHTEPLFIQLGLLKVQDIFKLRLLKFYYKLCYGTLPHYFNHNREIIERQPVRPLRQHLIHPPFLRTVYAQFHLDIIFTVLIGNIREEAVWHLFIRKTLRLKMNS